MKIKFKYKILYALLLFVSVDNIAQNYGQYEKDCDARCKYERYMESKNKKNRVESLSNLGSFECIAKDRDGISPFAVSDTGSGYYDDTPIVFDTLNECEYALTQELFTFEGYDDYLGICATQDEDGLSPYGVFTYEISTGTFYNAEMVYDSMSNCDLAMRNIISDGDTIYSCASVDADGLSPWAIMDLGSGAYVSEEFDSFEVCMFYLPEY
tara:strand:+ start:946 stop:1578 length:633 start_codon:yes stop_codon:yes gene_type:complete